MHTWDYREGATPAFTTRIAVDGSWLIYYVFLCVLYDRARYAYISRAESSFTPSQWKTLLLCNNVAHLLGTGLESAPHIYIFCVLECYLYLLVFIASNIIISMWLWFVSANPAIRTVTIEIWARGRNHYWTWLQRPSLTWDYYKFWIKFYLQRGSYTWFSVADSNMSFERLWSFDSLDSFLQRNIRVEWGFWEWQTEKKYTSCSIRTYVSLDRHVQLARYFNWQTPQQCWSSILYVMLFVGR